MSSLRRIVAVGLPTAGLTAFTALALGGSPAMAGATTAGLAPADRLAQPAAVATTCAAGDDRTKCGYGTAAPTGEPAATDEPVEPAATDEPDTTPTRGNPGYGSVAPSTPAPSASTPGVSPSSVGPETPVSAAATTPGGGVSAGELPVTGAPMGALVSMGALLVAGGATSVWYTRRRRSA